jgi:hypothetical protein
VKNQTTVELRQGATGVWKQADMYGVTDNGCAVEVPAEFQYGEFEVRAGGGTPFAVNVARPWFVFGDGGNQSSPGGWIRVIGTGICLSGGAVLRLTEQTSKTVLHLSSRDDTAVPSATRWHAFFDLPTSIAAGVYTVDVGSSPITSGPPATFTRLCTFKDSSTPCLSTITVATPTPFKTTVFTVKSVQPGPGRNATAGVQDAIAAAAANGGGVVYFPRGQYFIDGPMKVAPGTVTSEESE